MALSVDPLTYVITVPKADLTLIQSVPTEIRELNLNTFRLNLKGWEDEIEGIVQTKTHTHNTEVSLGGLTYARVIEILAPYSITFEDGAYAVNLTGANSNVGDKVNVNQVSVRSANSAGLISSPAIEYGSYQNQVTVDLINGSSGTLFPIGTPQEPVNNLADAKLIADYRGFNTIQFIGDGDMDTAIDFTDFVILGQNSNLTEIIVDTLAITNNCEFRECTLTGVLDGGSIIRSSIIHDLTYVNGVVFNTMINPGTITLGGGTTAHFLNCFSGVPGTSTPTIDFNNSSNSLAMRNYNGGIKLVNKSGIESVSIDLNSGQCILASTITGGTIVCRGVGKLIDESDNQIESGTWNGVTIVNETVNPEHITDHVWDEPLTGATHNIPNSAGRRLRDVSSAVIHTGEAASSTNNTITLNGDASSGDGAYDPSVISIINGTGFGQTRLILEYDGASKTAVVDRNWKINPDATSEYAIVSHPGREHINEGQAQGGTINTITLNALASSATNAYVGQVISVRSGTGEDQACRVIAYDGTTKVATMARDWHVIPDATSAYVMLPTSVLDIAGLKAGIADFVWEEDITIHTTTDSAGKLVQDTKRDVGDAQGLILSI